MVDTKKKKKESKNSELFIDLNDFKLNETYLNDVRIKLDDKSLVDKKYFSEQLKDITQSVSDLEKVKSGDKVLTMAQRFSSRLEKIRKVNPVNNLDTLRKAGMKELRLSIKETDKGGYLQFGKSQKDSWNSLLARVSKIGTVLLHKKDIFTIKKNNKGKLQVFTKDININPEVKMFVDNKPEWIANPNPDREVSVSGDAMERIYSNEIMGKFKSKVKDGETPKDNTQGSHSDTNGATAKTVNNIFSEMNNTFNWFKTKDPQQIVKNILEADFGNSGSDVSDPANFLLDAKDFAELITKLIEVVKLLNKEHPKTNPRIDDVLKVVSGVYFDRQEKTWKLTN
jgi:fatty acid-binding protein DegV